MGEAEKLFLHSKILFTEASSLAMISYLKFWLHTTMPSTKAKASQKKLCDGSTNGPRFCKAHALTLNKTWLQNADKIKNKNIFLNFKTKSREKCEVINLWKWSIYSCCKVIPLRLE